MAVSCECADIKASNVGLYGFNLLKLAVQAACTITQKLFSFLND